MDKLIQLRAFVRVAERASFSAVARDFEVTQSAISKAISALENSLGVRLVSRSTRTVALTAAGQQYYERCRLILADMDAADAVVADFTSAPVGSLSIAAPVPFGLMFISPRVARFKALHPSLEITLDLNDQPLNLVEGNIDVAIRLGHLKTQGFAARKLGESPFLTVASPAYLLARGLPEKLADLSTHHCIGYSNLDRPLEWTFISNGVKSDITVSSQYRSNNLLAIKDAAMAGFGIAQLPLWMVDSEIKAGLLRPLLEKFPLPGFDIHAVFPTSKQIPRKVRLFVDFIKDELGTVSHLLGTRR